MCAHVCTSELFLIKYNVHLLYLLDIREDGLLKKWIKREFIKGTCKKRYSLVWLDTGGNVPDPL